MYELRETCALRCTASLPSFPFDADGLISFLWPILNPESMFSKSRSRSALRRREIHQKPSHGLWPACARVKANELLFGLPPEKQGDEDKRIAVRGFGVLQYPQKKSCGRWPTSSVRFR
jgi:conjugal transfer ATP-binding protein TraC